MTRRVVLLMVLLVVVALAGLGLPRLGKPPGPPAVTLQSFHLANPPIARDDPPPTVDLNGAAMPFRQRLTGPAVVNFWASWCVPCVRELPLFAKFRPLAEAAGLQVLSVNLDKEGAPVALRFLQDRGISGLPVILDSDTALTRALAVRGIPTALLVNAQGEEVARLEGEADWSAPGAVEAVAGVLGLIPSPAGAK